MPSLGCFVCVSVCGCECVSMCVCQSVCVCASYKICFKLHFCGFQHRLFANICHLIFVSFQSVPIHFVSFRSHLISQLGISAMPRINNHMKGLMQSDVP